MCKWFDQGKLRGYREPISKRRMVKRDALVKFMVDNGLPVPAELQEVKP